MKSTLHSSRTQGRSAARGARAADKGSMLAPLTKFLLVLPLVLSLGLHWGILQSVAWVGMLVKYSQDASFAEAWNKTFDGNHPCNLCISIKKGQAEESKQDQQRGQSGPKLDFAILWRATEFEFEGAREEIFPSLYCLTLRTDPPPKPRPRIFSASLV
jgi:hypothetical protein